MHALLTRFPALKAKLPLLKLTELPTPVSRADTLANQLGIGSLTIKRDDLTGTVYGGNKVRKLELLLGDAIGHDCDAVLTFGSVGSNHALATSVYASQTGMTCYAILTDQDMTPNIPATLRYHALLDTKITHIEKFSQSTDAAARVVAHHPSGSEKLYTIEWGGSSWLGATGIVAGALELADQIPKNLAPDMIYVAGGTLGTAVGLAIGLRFAVLPTTLSIVQVTPPAVFRQDHFENLFNETIRELHARDASVPILDEPLRNVRVRGEFLGGGYADPTPESVEAVALAEEHESLKLEHTYSGKALAAVISDARKGELENANIMFWNTYNSRPYPEGLEDTPLDTLPETLSKYLGQTPAMTVQRKFP